VKGGRIEGKDGISASRVSRLNKEIKTRLEEVHQMQEEEVGVRSGRNQITSGYSAPPVEKIEWGKASSGQVTSALNKEGGTAE